MKDLHKMMKIEQTKKVKMHRIIKKVNEQIDKVMNTQDQEQYL